MPTPRSLRPSILLAAVLTQLAACSEAPAREQTQRVILITCDTLRADRLGVYGYERGTSPNLDAFAREAVVFDEAYSSAPWTGPALSSLFTGRLPDEIGVPAGNRFPLPREAVTLAEIARDAGIATAAVVSNWVLRRADPAGELGVAQGFETFDDFMPTREKNRAMYERNASATTDAALVWLERAGDDPFFMWVHYQDPHGPYMPPPEHAARFERPMGDAAPLELGKSDSGKGQLPIYQKLDAERRPEAYRMRYDAEIAYFDEHVGRLLDWLRTRAWYESALIVFSADHGESLGEHGYWFCHGENVYREVVRVPFVVRFPKGAPRVAARRTGAYERVSELVSHLDLWPTILEAFGLEARPNRGASLFHVRLPTDRVHAQTFSGPNSPRRWTGVSDGRWHLVVDPQKRAQLYDVAADPYETKDLAAVDPKQVEALLARYRTFLATHAVASLRQGPARTDPAMQDALKRLGYTAADGDEADEPHDH